MRIDTATAGPDLHQRRAPGAYLFSVCLSDGSTLGCRWIHTAAAGPDVHTAWAAATATVAAEATPGEHLRQVHAIGCHQHLTTLDPTTLERTWPEAFAHIWGERYRDEHGRLVAEWVDHGPVALRRAIPVIEYRALGAGSTCVEEDPVAFLAHGPATAGAGCPLFFEEYESSEARRCPQDSVCDDPDDDVFPAFHAPGGPGGPSYRVRWVFTAPLECDVAALGPDPAACLASRHDVEVVSRTDTRAQLLAHLGR